MNAINMLGAVQATQIVLWAVLGVMVVLLLVSPMITRRRQARDFEAMLNNISVGDKIMTNIGMIGTIKKINRKADGTTFFLETGEKTVIELDVGAIARVLSSVKPIPTAASKSKKSAEPTKEIEETEEQKTEDNKVEKKEVDKTTKKPVAKKVSEKPSAKKATSKSKK